MNKKKVLFRSDGNTHIGLGHIYRCIAVAEMLKADFDCWFLLSQTSQVKNIIPDHFPVKQIPATVSLASEPQWIKSNFNTTDLIIILDGYHFNSDYQKNIKDLDLKLIYIDDLETEHMFADVVINHSPSANAAHYKKEKYTTLLLGMKYALLRNGFLHKAKHPANQINKAISNVLVSLGGSDEHNITLKIFEALDSVHQLKKIEIVIGAAYMFKELIAERIRHSQKEVHLLSNLSEVQMIGLMSSCDAAFVPCSTTCFEIFAINKPVFAGISADNQLGPYTSFKNNKLIFDLGDLRKTTVKEIKETVEGKMDNIPEINKMLTLQKQLLDGRSGERILGIVKEVVE